MSEEPAQPSNFELAHSSYCSECEQPVADEYVRAVPVSENEVANICDSCLDAEYYQCEAFRDGEQCQTYQRGVDADDPLGMFCNYCYKLLRRQTK